MAVTVYKDTEFQGIYARLTTGFYSGRDLVGCAHLSSSCEEIDNAINSIRVEANTIVSFADGHSISASNGKARVLIGPVDISDLNALGMSNRISSIRIASFRPYDWVAPIDKKAIICDGYSLIGRRSELRRGDYTMARLASEEVKLTSLRSLSVESGVLAILYEGPNFETTMDAIMLVGPTIVEDLNTVGMLERIKSIRILYNDTSIPQPAVQLVVPPQVPLIMSQPQPQQPRTTTYHFSSQTPPHPVNAATAAAVVKPIASIVRTGEIIMFFIVLLVIVATIVTILGVTKIIASVAAPTLSI
jgi:hypothetical protein